jgi:chemotaxis protein CheX
MSDCTIELPSYPIEDFLAPHNLELADATVIEVFNLVFGYDVAVAESSDPSLPPSSSDERTAIVGLSGSMRGSCQIRMTTVGAQSIAAAMLGGPVTEDDDDEINDALGELCNMLAGGWKNGVHGLSSECSLSPPTVVSGRDYRVHMSKPSQKLSRTYRFDIHILHLTLCREETAPLQG